MPSGDRIFFISGPATLSDMAIEGSSVTHTSTNATAGSKERQRPYSAMASYGGGPMERSSAHEIRLNRGNPVVSMERLNPEGEVEKAVKIKGIPTCSWMSTPPQGQVFFLIERVCVCVYCVSYNISNPHSRC